MYKTEYVDKTTQVIQLVSESRICNKCGKEHGYDLRVDNMSAKYNYDAEIQNIKLQFGYGSSNDGDVWDFDLCEDCLEELISTFKFLPKGHIKK